MTTYLKVNHFKDVEIEKCFENNEPLQMEILKQNIAYMKHKNKFLKSLFVLLSFPFESKIVEKRDDIRDANNYLIKC